MSVTASTYSREPNPDWPAQRTGRFPLCFLNVNLVQQGVDAELCEHNT